MSERRAPGFTASLREQIILGNKTQTRIICKPQPEYGIVGCLMSGTGFALIRSDGGCSCKPVTSPHGQPGDVWALREPMHQEFTTSDADAANGCLAVYADDQVVIDRRTGRCACYDWERETLASISMPLWAARDSVTLKRVWVERVRDISEEDAFAEGIVETEWGMWQPPGTASLDGGTTYHPFKERRVEGRFHSGDATGPEHCLGSARHAFGNRWNSLHAKPNPVYLRDIKGGTTKSLDHYVSHPWEDVQETREYLGKPWIVLGNPWVWCFEFGDYQRGPGRKMEKKR